MVYTYVVRIHYMYLPDRVSMTTHPTTNSSQRDITEKAVEKYLSDTADKHNVRCLKFTSPAHSGVPDRILVGINPHTHQALTIFCEVKRPGHQLQAHQEYSFADLRSHGGLVCVVDSPNAIDTLFAHTFNYDPDNP